MVCGFDADYPNACVQYALPYNCFGNVSGICKTDNNNFTYYWHIVDNNLQIENFDITNNATT
jgi:hypothetical protein